MRNLRTEQEIMANWRGKATQPVLSISCITYNHENFIEDALEGFLIQETDFPFEILIHDDASLDRTDAIIREYEAKYPNLIKPIYQTENQFSKNDGTIGRIQRGRAKGKYIALCEGDDYWTNPHKLQKQVDFLEENPEYSICFHEVNIQNDINGSVVKRIPPSNRKKFQFIDLIRYCNFIPTCSVLFNKEMRGVLPTWFYEMPVGDWPLFMILSKNGPIGYLNENMANYRIHHSGFTTINAKEQFSRRKNLYVQLYNKIGIGYENEFRQAIIWQRKNIIRENLRELKIFSVLWNAFMLLINHLGVIK